ncbi:hypothetical protein F0230_08970 [Vibrio aestuarianus]|nr:hypothetical protein [Vibrio sp. 1180_3]NOI62709.1 hypothetical protein [Vibrio aestuarianus]
MAVLVPVFDHKHVSLFKKSSNGYFQRIYSKKLLTLLSHIRIMRSVLNVKQNLKKRAKKENGYVAQLVRAHHS